MIERLPDAPAAFDMGLLRYDPYVNALLCITSEGILAFDIVNRVLGGRHDQGLS